MRTKNLLLVTLPFIALISLPASAQDDHVDEGNPWEVSDVHGDHDNGFCDNISGDDKGRDVDCIDRGFSSPREHATECGRDALWGDLECSAWVTTYCPGLGIGSGPGKDFLTFSCFSGAGAEVRAGVLDGHYAFPQKRGVSCTQGFTGQTVSCGCIATSTSSSYFFGNPQPLSYPNAYTCGSVN